ncbi:type I glutamate--ammonia ligase [Ignicoccus islandicus]|uniref:type I glutamate--ammonia ligase n=1 Tax=Ignicoccus islandicus TaxID=54259 RepID=UPI001C252391|nr:type I glutamate--ammonia ligase [Ignicoccus islandicus]
MSTEEVLKVVEKIKSENVRWIDIHFVDVPGRLQHTTFPARELLDDPEETFNVAIGGFDGSSITGFTVINESDMLLRPIPETFAIIPDDWQNPPGVAAGRTARFIAQIFWGGYKKGEAPRFEKDPRYIAERAESYLAEQGYKAYFGPEVEFTLFDKLKVDINMPWHKMCVEINYSGAPWDTQLPIMKFKQGYFPANPYDKLFWIRQEIASVLEDYFGFQVEAHHHEVAGAGQGEIDFRFDTAVRAADKVVTLKYVVKNIAAKYGMVATFMPKPIYGDNGNGMHTHQSLWDIKSNKNLFYDPNDEYAELSQLARYYIGGILKHARALSAIVNPTTSSYKRLVPGYEAPIYIAWSKSNRSAIIRVPNYMRGIEKAARIEYRSPDPSTNPYLAFAAMVAAGLDGIRKKIEPPDPVDENIYAMDPKKKAELEEIVKKQLDTKLQLPSSLCEALDELESDHDWLFPIFTKEMYETWIELKREDCKRLNAYPHPVEYYEYFDI